MKSEKRRGLMEGKKGMMVVVEGRECFLECYLLWNVVMLLVNEGFGEWCER